MRASEIAIQNYRSIREATVKIDDVTRIIGANGAGKSTVLKALQLFYAPGTPHVDIDDFFHKDSSAEIVVAITFDDLSEAENLRFGGHVRTDGTMSVSRVLSHNPKVSGRYFGVALRNPAFAGVRSVDGAREKTASYKALQGAFPDLPDVSRAADVEEALAKWEQAHPDACEPGRDDGQFFGFQNVAQGKLNDCTRLVYIPAVRDASVDAADGKNSPVAQLLELVVKSAIETRRDIVEFRNGLQKDFEAIMAPENLTELSGLADQLSATLQAYYQDTSIQLSWKDIPALSVPFPSADLRVDDDGFLTTVDRTGHGLQRALIVTLLQHLVVATRSQSQSTTDDEGSDEGAALLPGLILAIEETEIYQHPTKQRHVARVLERLVLGEIPGVSTQMQVVFTTHSPLFVAMERFGEVRVVRRHRNNPDDLRRCAITVADLNEVARKLENAWGRPPGSFTEDSLKSRLHVIDGSTAEGFFSGTAVLVEGKSDQAAIQAAAEVGGVDLTSAEIAVLGVGGKSNIDKPYSIFRELGIPVFVMWDNDNGGEPHINLALQRLLGVAADGLAEAVTRVEDLFTCHENNLETTLISEIGREVWERLLDEIKNEYGIGSRNDAQKVPRIMSELLRRAAAEGHTSATLNATVERILRLAGRRIIQA